LVSVVLTSVHVGAPQLTNSLLDYLLDLVERLVAELKDAISRARLGNCGQTLDR
jgi:hypothetical protein